MPTALFLAHHVRDKKGKPFATLVALSATAIGLSICNKKDLFTKKRGLAIATARALKAPTKDLLSEDSKRHIAINAALRNFTERAQKYFAKNPSHLTKGKHVQVGSLTIIPKTEQTDPIDALTANAVSP